MTTPRYRTCSYLLGLVLIAIETTIHFVTFIENMIPDGHFKIPHLWPGQNPPPEVRSYSLSERAS